MQLKHKRSGLAKVSAANGSRDVEMEAARALAAPALAAGCTTLFAEWLDCLPVCVMERQASFQLDRHNRTLVNFRQSGVLPLLRMLNKSAFVR